VINYVETAGTARFASGPPMPGRTAADRGRCIDRTYGLVRYSLSPPRVHASLRYGAGGGLRRRQSGFGREGGRAGLEEFIRVKGVSVGRDPGNFLVTDAP
jgi:hypothetical protein